VYEIKKKKKRKAVINCETGEEKKIRNKAIEQNGTFSDEKIIDIF
jgi:hypothetical protein